MWSHAPRLQQPTPDDYVVATGETHQLKDFVAKAILQLSDWTGVLMCDFKMVCDARHGNFLRAVLNPTKRKSVLGWSAQMRMPEIVGAMIAAYRKHCRNARVKILLVVTSAGDRPGSMHRYAELIEDALGDESAIQIAR